MKDPLRTAEVRKHKLSLRVSPSSIVVRGATEGFPRARAGVPSPGSRFWNSGFSLAPGPVWGLTWALCCCCGHWGAAAVTSRARSAGLPGKRECGSSLRVVPLGSELRRRWEILNFRAFCFGSFFRCKLIQQNFKGVLNRGVVFFLSQHLTGRVFFKKLISWERAAFSGWRTCFPLCIPIILWSVWPHISN